MTHSKIWHYFMAMAIGRQNVYVTSLIRARARSPGGELT